MWRRFRWPTWSPEGAEPTTWCPPTSGDRRVVADLRARGVDARADADVDRPVRVRPPAPGPATSSSHEQRRLRRLHRPPPLGAGRRHGALTPRGLSDPRCRFSTCQDCPLAGARVGGTFRSGAAAGGSGCAREGVAHGCDRSGDPGRGAHLHH
jgi:hypothetical protein